MKLSSIPHLVKEWHPTNNGELTPNDFTHGSHFKAWWLCSKAHSYESIIQSRAGKKPYGCPYCSGKRVSKENNQFPASAGPASPTVVTYAAIEGVNAGPPEDVPARLAALKWGSYYRS